MKFAWWGKIMDIASSNSDQVEVVSINKYCEMLENNVWEYKFKKGKDGFVIDDLSYS